MFKPGDKAFDPRYGVIRLYGEKEGGYLYADVSAIHPENQYHRYLPNGKEWEHAAYPILMTLTDAAAKGYVIPQQPREFKGTGKIHIITMANSVEEEPEDYVVIRIGKAKRWGHLNIAKGTVTFEEEIK